MCQSSWEVEVAADRQMEKEQKEEILHFLLASGLQLDDTFEGCFIVG